MSREMNSMINEIIVDNVLTEERQPDGSSVPIIDPYEGCNLNCPYCFRLDNEGWFGKINVKSNIPQMIKKELKNWSKEDLIFIGSLCDPYMSIEKQYEITRKCIVELDKLHIPCMIVTKSGSEIILRDIDIIRNYKSDITVLMGLSNLSQLSSCQNSWEIKNIRIANKLYSLGIKVWVFITPILPGITDVDKMIEMIHNDIPIHLDKLRLEKGTKSAISMLEFIKKNKPNLETIYERIINNNLDPYYEELKSRLQVNKRITFLPE